MKGDSRMSSHEANEKGATRSNPRRPYVKPAFCSEPVLEIRAMACGKSSGAGLCSVQPSTS